ncbi:MAG: ATP-binding protein [Candidatus Symbiothrix sp.]|jgi:AAA15 family ATPase/GTPase|nr:ATP-binding protein [Candidatus Symbiothrix sp.]
MILNLSVQNYRSFKDEISFSMVAGTSDSKGSNFFSQALAQGEDEVRLLKIASIYGPNASGKSNLLKLLFDLVKYITVKPKISQSIPLYDPFKFEIESKTLPTDLSIEFILNRIKYKYDIKFDASKIIAENLSYYPEKKQRNIYSRIIDGSNEISHEAKFGSDIKGVKWKGFPNQLILSSFGEDIPDPIISEVYKYFSTIKVVNSNNSNHLKLLKDEIDYIIADDPKLHSRLNRLISLADTKMKGIKLEKIDGLLAENTSSFNQEKRKYKIYGTHSLFQDKQNVGDEYLPMREESQGTFTFYCICGILLKSLKEGTTIFIDELETSLHPNLARLLVSLFQDQRMNPKNAQLIFTTHEIELLDSSLFRKDQIWITEKDDFGVTDLFSLQDFNSVREDTPFDKWYLAGKFGGIPKIKSLQSIEDNGDGQVY